MGRSIRVLGAILAICGAGALPALARETPPTDWAQVAADDLHFIRATLRENHPGPVDAQNPAFHDWYVRGFDASLTKAAQAVSFAGYFFAVQHYVIGFQDGHLGVGAAVGDSGITDDRFMHTRLERRWPGFTATMRQGEFFVTEADGMGPAIGSRLISCDGRDAETLTHEIIAPYLPLWSVRGARPRVAPMLFVDEGNPFVQRPERCIFERNGSQATYDLRWAPISGTEIAAKVEAAAAESAPEFGVRRFSAGYWISIPSFLFQDESVRAQVDRLVSNIVEQRDAIRHADTVVIDVRGNGGGSASLGREIAAALWGDELIAARPAFLAGNDWRVSPRNLARMRTTAADLAGRYGEDSARATYYRGLVARVEAALANGDPFLYEPAGSPAPSPPVANPVSARVMLLTDSACFSACLDFADLVLSIPGVAQVGAETRADTIYIENRFEWLPSANGLLYFSMKVNRGRVRGNNESYIPTHEWSGSMADTAGLEAWIDQLPR